MVGKKNKKGIELLNDELVFIILNTLFFLALLFFVYRSVGPEINLEESYAKKIGLILDEISPQTEINIDVSELLDYASKNKFNGNVIKIDPLTKSVSISVSEKSKYTYNYFSGLELESRLNMENKILTIRT